MKPRVILALVVSIAAAVTLAADPPKLEKKDKIADIKRRFYQCWLEIESIDAGMNITDPNRLTGNEFDPEHFRCWGRRGELSASFDKPGPRIDPTTDPMRVDFVGRGPSRNFGGTKGDEEVTVMRPCLFKFDGDNLVIAYADRWTVEKKFKEGEDYPERPKDFTSTKENKRTVTTMKVCGFYDQD
jgi:hypothetical protein